MHPSGNDPQRGDVIGIDLGTTNSAIAYWRDSFASLKVVEVEQLQSPGATVRQRVLPSFLYIPHTGELSASETKLSWSVEGTTDAVVGVWARERGALAAERLVSSAKSWLAFPHVDRQEKILPWRSEINEGKVSPVDASTAYLRHLLAALEQERQGATTRDARDTVVLTVPASFDEVARQLTYEAAQRTGLNDVILLEEPLAAFYAWLDARGEQWRESVQPGDLVLICDVGGGTTDFSLVAVTETDGQLALERISVGEHLLLGGDNMDLTLAHALKRELESQGQSLDHWQFLSLVSAARHAKERLLADTSLDEVPISVASRGASLFAGTMATRLTRAQVEALLVTGFFPLSAIDEMPKSRRATGIQQLGLAYEADPAISRHLARFLTRSRQNIQSNADLARLASTHLKEGQPHVMPTAVLFNGGVFNAPVLRERVLELLRLWNDGHAVKELTGSTLDLAVAQGAVYYGRLRATGQGLRVRSGTARSYYIGIDSPMPAVPGFEPPLRGLCLVPQGTDEGTEILLEDRQFGLVVGEPVEFRFFSSTVRAGDAVGTEVEDATSALEESARIGMTLTAEGRREGEIVPVRLDAVVTEVGTLQLYMKDVASDQKWHLEFDVRRHEPN